MRRCRSTGSIRAATPTRAPDIDWGQPRKPWVAPGRSDFVLYNPAINATHSIDTGVPGSSSAWWHHGMCGGMSDLRKIWHDTSHIIDTKTRQEVTRQMMEQYATLHADPCAALKRTGRPAHCRPRSAASATSLTQGVGASDAGSIRPHRRASKESGPTRPAAHLTAAPRMLGRQDCRQRPIFANRLSGLMETRKQAW